MGNGVSPSPVPAVEPGRRQGSSAEKPSLALKVSVRLVAVKYCRLRLDSGRPFSVVSSPLAGQGTGLSHQVRLNQANGSLPSSGTAAGPKAIPARPSFPHRGLSWCLPRADDGLAALDLRSRPSTAGHHHVYEDEHQAVAGGGLGSGRPGGPRWRASGPRPRRRGCAKDAECEREARATHACGPPI